VIGTGETLDGLVIARYNVRVGTVGDDPRR
jgi:hypothetical protein